MPSLEIMPRLYFLLYILKLTITYIKYTLESQFSSLSSTASNGSFRCRILNCLLWVLYPATESGMIPSRTLYSLSFLSRVLFQIILCSYLLLCLLECSFRLCSLVFKYISMFLRMFVSFPEYSQLFLLG